jgi:hypothetical protein
VRQILHDADEQHLRRVLTEYLMRYNRARPLSGGFSGR